MDKLTKDEKKKINLHLFIMFLILSVYIYTIYNFKNIFCDDNKFKYLFYLDFYISCIIIIYILLYPRKYIELIKSNGFVIICIIYLFIYIYMFKNLKFKINN